MKTAFVFPGQGAQYIGMASDYLQKEENLKAILNDFDKAHNINLATVMAEGPEEILKQTSYTQPAILFHSVAALKAFQTKSNLKPDFVAGHSLGEFSALVAAGMISLADALHLVHKRGAFMIKANADVPFGMSAIIGLEADQVIQICRQASVVGLVEAVNFNTPMQTVISGTEEGVLRAGELARMSGAKRVIPLVVGGPFHTPVIVKASEWLMEEMQKVEFKDIEIPVISNVTAAPVTSGKEERELLAKQIVSPVLWSQSVQFMIDQGVTRFIEFGPQKVLSGMIRNINRDAEVFSIDKYEDIDAVVSVTN